MGKKTKTVLIVDDDANITRTFVRILEKNGFAAEVALTGKEAQEKAKNKFYAAVLIDKCLPDIDGIELLDTLEEHGCRMVKIVITGFPISKPKKADAYFVKPVRPQELIRVLEEKLSEQA